MTKTELRKNVEDFLRRERIFNLVLKKNPSLYSNKLNQIGEKYFWFAYKDSDIEFIGEPIISDTKNEYGDYFDVYISDFIFRGSFCYSNESHEEIKEPIELIATLRIFKSPDSEVEITNTNHVKVWDFNQKLINLIYFFANKKLSGLSLIPYDFEFYTKPRSKIDIEESNYKKQSHVTSYYYLQELIECYEKIKHLLSIVLLVDEYSNHYTTIKRKLPSNYNTPHMIEINSNFQLYDRYFLVYSELVIENLYKFWERVGFYIFQFLKPNITNKRKLSFLKLTRNTNETSFYIFKLIKNQYQILNDNNLSLYKLIKELNKEYNQNSNLQNVHFDWFVKFVLDKNSEFDKLLHNRHPFIHYKIDKKTGQGIGSLIAGILNKWSKNMFDESGIRDLESENKKIKDFLIMHFDFCQEGYNHMIELINNLPNKKS